MRRGTIFFFFLFFLIGMLPDASAEVDLNNITIYRDNYGVPHIHAKSDEELAYGLAWATAEDDFGSIQENVLAVRGRLAEVQGKKGAIMDFIAFALGLNEQVEKEFEQQTSPEFRSVMEAYVRAINRYAELHPKEVKLKKLFPVSSKDLMAGYMLGMAFIANAQEPLTQIFSGSIKIHEAKLPKGSNAIAISPKKSADGGTYVAINSHQPLVGPYSWYEAHLVNDKVNMHGATFPGGMSLFVGANEHFAWAHTVNHPDFNDVYKLEMHPNKKLTYKYDGQWKTLKQRTKKIKVKVWFFKVRAKRTFYWSEYGPTIKTDDGFYSVRMPSIYEMASAEQWHHMNRATDWASFRATLDQQGHCGTNLIYGDKEGHIYYVSNGLFPIRDTSFNWQKVLPGNTSKTKWTRDYYPVDSLVQVFDPPSGYLYNSNNTPFHCSDTADNPDPKNYPSTLGYRMVDNNRAHRLHTLLRAEDSITYERFKEIKYDRKFNDPIRTSYMDNLNDIRNLDPAQFPDIAKTIQVLNEWELGTEPESKGATIMSLFLELYLEGRNAQGLVWQVDHLSDEQFADILRDVQKHLKRKFKSVEVPLGEFQRHIRGKVNLPIGGTPDVLAAQYIEPYKRGRFKVMSGESFIMLVHFKADGTYTMEAVNAYGASANEKSPHYTDQMELYVNQQLRPVQLELDPIKANAQSSYHPQ